MQVEEAPMEGVQFLCYFFHTRVEFRLAELESLARLFNYPVHYNKEEHDPDRPFLTVTLPSEKAAADIASRAVLIKGFFEKWGEGVTYEELLASLDKYPKEKMEVHGAADKSFKFVVDGFGRKYNNAERIEIMKRFAPLPLHGKISLEEQDNQFWIIEDIGNNAPKDMPPRKVYFARQIAEGAGRIAIDKYSLKKRGYLGTTSMSSEWSLLMANQALARAGSFVFDPFVGTGSILVGCAHFGAMTIGGDIDPRVLRGDTKLNQQVTDGSTNIFTNFAQYGMNDRLVDLVACDGSRPCWRRNTQWYDAIVGDPPYGVRAGARKIGKKVKRKVKEARVDADLPHIPQSVPYEVPDVLRDLLVFAAQTLVMGGRLVYWLPTTDQYKDSDVPLHPCLKLLANSEQVLSMRLRRRLITMEKIMDFDPSIHSDVTVTYGEDAEAPAHAHVSDYFLKRKQFAEDKKEPHGHKEDSTSSSSSSSSTQ
jgi:tRNA (guanine10-N2)-methyltransferase